MNKNFINLSISGSTSNSLWFRILFYLLAPVILFSCTTQKQLTYLQDIEGTTNENYFINHSPDYRLQKQDILYIKITTFNEEINGVLSGGASTSYQNMFISESQVYINGFSVNDSGFISLPLIGDVFVLNKSIEETKLEIENVSKEFVKDATVIVKLISFKITVLGEVNLPGAYYVYRSNATILEAIGLASDITDFGDRSRILIVRSTENGTRTFYINLQQKDILSSEAFYLMPDDVIIVNPLKAKFLQLNSPTFSFFIGTIVTTISLTILILTL